MAASGNAQEDSTEGARHQYRQALEAKHAKNWLEARRLLLELWEQVRTYDVAGSLGEVEHKLGNPAAAAQYFAYSLANLSPREKADTVEQVRRALQVMKEQVATVRFEVHPKTADVRVDGRPIDFSPLPEEVYVQPGLRTFVAVVGPDRAIERLEVAAGKEYRVVLRVEQQEALPDPGLDPEPSASAPASTMTAPGSVPEDQGSGRSLVPVYVGAGLTAVGVGAWIGFGVDARGSKDDVGEYQRRIGADGCVTGTSPDCVAAQDALERQRRSGVIGNVGLGIGVAAGTATLAYLLFWPNSTRQEPGTTVRPSVAVDRTGGTFGLSGEF